MIQERVLIAIKESLDLGIEMSNLSDLLDIPLSELKQFIKRECDLSPTALTTSLTFFLRHPELFDI